MTARPAEGGQQLNRWLDHWLGRYGADLVTVRRRIHAHPELAFAEHATTALLVEQLTAGGLAPQVLPAGTGVVCELGSGPGPVTVLRADLDALPITDEKDVPYASTVPGVSHACGHDVHTTVLLGTALALGARARSGGLGGRVRCVFQPAEETIPGGALTAIDAGVLRDAGSVFTVHCDPRVDVGQLGMRVGPITAACDTLVVRLRGNGGHTARPHLTGDLVYALGDLVSRLPALLSRRVDPRSGLSLVWGQVQAGTAHNVIPQSGSAAGTVRCLDRPTWERAPDLIRRLADQVLAPYGLEVELDYRVGLPPVVNDAGAVAAATEAAHRVIGPDSVVPTEQSMGGEDFAWFTEAAAGALTRLGVRRPGEVEAPDLHRGTFDVDERAIAIGIRLLTATALAESGR